MMTMGKTGRGRRQWLKEDGPRRLMMRKWTHRGGQVTRTGDGDEDYDGLVCLTMRNMVRIG